jgi:hypothetical protein
MLVGMQNPNVGEILIRLHKLFGTATMCIASLQTLLAAPQEFHALLHSGQFLHFFCFFSCKSYKKNFCHMINVRDKSNGFEV